MEQHIEVELRSFVTAEEYERLLAKMEAEGDKIEETNQETWYFDKDSHLRLVRGDKSAKLCLKGGVTHDEEREEIDLPIAREHVEAAHALLRGIGHEIEVLWLRHRRRYMWQGIDVALDNTEGYGRILELEILVAPGAEQQALDQLHAAFTTLGITPSAKEEFSQRYKEYLASWRERLGM